MSFGWTNLISSSISSSLSRAAQTSPSKSLRVTSRHFSWTGAAMALLSRGSPPDRQPRAKLKPAAAVCLAEACGRPTGAAKSDTRPCRCKGSPLPGSREKRHPRREAGSQSQGSHVDGQLPRDMPETAQPLRPALARARIAACARPARRLGTRRLLGSRARVLAGDYLAPTHSALWLANGGWTLAALGAVLGVADATRRSGQPSRRGWTLLLCGSLLWLAGQLFWDAYGATVLPGLAESGRLLLARLRGAGGCRRPPAVSPRARLDQDLTARDRAADRRRLDAGDLAADRRSSDSQLSTAAEATASPTRSSLPRQR